MQWPHTIVGLILCTALVVGSCVWMRPFWQHWRNVATAWLTVSICWTVLSGISTAHNWWDYSSAYIFGYHLFGLPIEAYMALFIAPLAGVLALYMLGKHVNIKGYVQTSNAQRMLLFIAGVVLFCMAAQMHKTCTLIGALLALGVIALLYRSSFINQRVFWYWNGLMLLCCFVFGTVFSSLVIYNDAYITGVYIGVVPVEHFLYSWSLLNMFALVFRAQSLRSAYQTLLERRPRITPIVTPRATHPSTYQSKPADTENDTT